MDKKEIQIFAVKKPPNLPDSLWSVLSHSYVNVNAQDSFRRIRSGLHANQANTTLFLCTLQ